MKNNGDHLEKKVSPPRLASRLLSWYCRPHLLEDLQGDLNEYFERNIQTKGAVRARLIYWMDVIKFMRPYTFRRPQFVNLLIEWIMIGSYLRSSGRNIVRNKLFSTINIVGLAISLSVGLLMIAFLSDLGSYDKFHTKANRIFRVNTTFQELENSPRSLASTSVKAGKRIKDEFSGIEDVAILRQGFGGDIAYGDSQVPIEGLWATGSFFHVFSFALVQGNTSTALTEPYSIVLTKKSVKKIFGEADALGKSLILDSTQYVVTGVMEDVPRFSHIQFDALVSFSTKELAEKDNKNFLSWISTWSNYVYVVMEKDGQQELLDRDLAKLNLQENAMIKNSSFSVWSQPLLDIAISEDLGNPIGPMMFTPVIWVLVGLTAIVLLCAAFNYTNLSVARALRRSREVGIRKVIGASKRHVVGQFVSEAVLISLLSLTLAFFLFLFLKPHFLSIAPELSGMVALDLSWKLFGYFVVLALFIGLLAGILPAVFFSRINPVSVLKDVSTVKLFQKVTLRKGLIVLQYVFSLVFISATIIGYQQYKHFLAFDLGFKTRNILNVKLQGNKPAIVIKEFSEIPGITGLSTSSMVTSVGTYWGGDIKYKNPHDSVSIYYNLVDENYLSLHEHHFLAGRNFKSGVEGEIVLTEELVKKLNIAKGLPSGAIGELVRMDGKELEVVGVIKDFHYGKVKDEVFPVAFRYSEKEAAFINAKVLSDDIQATLVSLDGAWRKVDKVHPLLATFYADEIERAYSEFSAMIKIIGFLAFLAISIASLGLFGMVVFTAETRLREMSIRKVLGASDPNLLYLLSKGFLILLMASALVALPLTYLFFDQVVLPEIAFHEPISIATLISGTAGVLVLALIMILAQTIRVAKSNPAEILKNE